MVDVKLDTVSKGKNVSLRQQTQPILISTVEDANVLEMSQEGVNDTVFTLTNNGNAPSTFSETSFGSFTTIVGLAIDHNTNNVYVSDGDIIKVFDSSGTSLFDFGGTGTEDGKFVDLFRVRIINGRLFAIDLDGSVSVFELDGTFLFKFGDGYLINPFDIAIDSRENYYVANNKGTIRIYDQTFKTKNVISTGMTDLTSIAISSDDRIFLVDSTDDLVNIYGVNGVLIKTFGTTGSGNGEFDRPINVSINRSDSIVISDSDNDRIQTFDKYGNFLFLAGVTNSDPIGLDFNYDDNTTYVASTQDNTVRIVSITGVTQGVINYKVFGSSSRDTDLSNSDDPEWVNLLSIRDIEEGNSSAYDHDFIIAIPISARTYESFSNQWQNVLVKAISLTNITTLVINGRGQS